MKHWALRTISEILSQEWKVLIWRGKKDLSNFEVLGKLQQLPLKTSILTDASLLCFISGFVLAALWLQQMLFINFPRSSWHVVTVIQSLRCGDFEVWCGNISNEQYYIQFIHNSSECPKNVIPAPSVSPQGCLSLFFSVSIALCSGSTRFIIHCLAHTLDSSIDLMLPTVWFLKQSMINLWQLLPEWPEGKKHRMAYLSWCMALRWICCFWTWVSDQTWEYNNESIKNPFCLSLSFSQCFSI